MQSRIFIILCILLFSTSCQAGHPSQAENSKEVKSPTGPAIVTSETPEATPRPAAITDRTAEPVPTHSPITAADAKCFTSAEGSQILFMPDSNRVVIRERSTVRIFNLETMEDESIIEAPQMLGPVALSPDGELLAWTLGDNTVQLIQIADQKLLKSLEAQEMPVSKLRFSAEGERLFTASPDTWVRIWDRNGKLLDSFQPTGADDLPNEIDGIGISPDETLLGSIPFDGPTRVWDLATKKEVANLGNTGGDVTSNVAFSPDGIFVAVDTLGRLSLWTTSDWKMVWEKAQVMNFAFSPRDQVLVYSDMENNNKIVFHSLVDSQNTHTLEGVQSFIYDLVFSPDGALLASAGAGIQIWQVDTGELVYVGKSSCP